MTTPSATRPVAPRSLGTDGVLILTNEDIKAVVDIPSYIDALEIAFKELGQGVAQNMPRRRLFTPLDEPDTHHWYNVIAGVVPGLKTAALRLNSGRMRIEQHFGSSRMEFPDTVVGFVNLFDVETGTLVATLHDHYINPIRVACTSALGAKYMTRRDSEIMAVLGTGWQARWHITALAHVLPFCRINVYSPNSNHVKRFITEQSKRFSNIEFVGAQNAENAVRGADVVVAATNSITPVLNGEWLKAGTHVISISGPDLLDRRKEVDDLTVTRSSLIVLNSILQMELDEQRDLLPLLKSGQVATDKVIELSQLVCKGMPLLDEKDIRFHFNNTGMGIQFAAVGARMYEAALTRGIGSRMPYTWRGRGV